MTKERPITWSMRQGRRRPIAKTLTNTVRNFFGKSGPRVETDSDRLYIAASKNHWIEVELSPETVSVVTRNVDSAIDKTADRLAEYIARIHRGEYSPPWSIEGIPLEDEDPEAYLDVWDPDDPDLD